MAAGAPRGSLKPADFVLEAGGVKGAALVGALAAFEEAGWRPNRIAGTSAGSVVGALYASGMPVSEIHDLLVKKRFSDFVDPTFLQRLPLPLVGSVLSELFDAGLYKGESLESYLAGVLAKHGVKTFADLRLDDPGMDPAVPPEMRYRLVVVAADQTREREEHLPWHFGRDYGVDPDTQSVARAAHMSSAIPYFFTPVRLCSALTGETSDMVDGGVTDGFPVTIFDRTDGRPPRFPTFKIALETRVAPNQKVGEIGNPVDRLKRLLNTLLEGRNRNELDDPQEVGRTMYIDTSDVSATDFGIDSATAEKLYRRGHAAAQQFLRTFSMQRYVRNAAIQRQPRTLLAQGTRAPGARHRPRGVADGGLGR